MTSDTPPATCGFCNETIPATIPYPKPGDTTCSSCMSITTETPNTAPDILTHFEPDEYIPPGSTVEWRKPTDKPREYTISIVLHDNKHTLLTRPIGIHSPPQRITRAELLAVYRP